MTFLEYVTERLLGEPLVRRGNGESEWPCPHCASPKFHTLPHKPPFKDRFRCWTCGFRGDLPDLMREFYPSENYGDHLARLDEWRRDWKADVKPTPRRVVPPGSSGSRRDDPHDVEVAWAYMDKLGEPEEVRRLLVRAKDFADRFDVTLDGLAVYCAEFEVWSREREAEHMAECKDPDCDAACCRRARGWSEKAIKRDIERARQRRWEGRKPRINGRI